MVLLCKIMLVELARGSAATSWKTSESGRRNNVQNKESKMGKVIPVLAIMLCFCTQCLSQVMIPGRPPKEVKECFTDRERLCDEKMITCKDSYMINEMKCEMICDADAFVCQLAAGKGTVDALVECEVDRELCYKVCGPMKSSRSKNCSNQDKVCRQSNYK